MKLTKRHIGQLFDVEGGDGSWFWQLVDIKKESLLFYSMTNQQYYIEDGKRYHDWRHYKGQKFSKNCIEDGWKMGVKTT